MLKERTNNLVAQKELRRKLRRKSTPEEVALWGLLRAKQICGCQFRRQFSIGPYIMDFYCPEVRLCVELDGRMHYAEENQKHDNRRDAYLLSRDIEVLRVENEALWKCSDLVVATIEDRVKIKLKDKKFPI